MLKASARAASAAVRASEALHHNLYRLYYMNFFFASRFLLKYKACIQYIGRDANIRLR